MSGVLAGTTGARNDARAGMIVATTGAQGARHHNRKHDRGASQVWLRRGGARCSSHRLEGCSPAAAPHSRGARPSTGLRGGGGRQSRSGRRDTVDRVCAEARAEFGVDPHRRSRDDAAQVRSMEFEFEPRPLLQLWALQQLSTGSLDRGRAWRRARSSPTCSSAMSIARESRRTSPRSTRSTIATLQATTRRGFSCSCPHGPGRSMSRSIAWRWWREGRHK